MDRKSLGTRLREAREAAGLTQLTVGLRVGLARSTISGIEHDSREVRPEEMRAFERLYGKALTDVPTESAD